MSRSLHLAIATAIGLAFAAPALAQSQPEERVVTYGDLNLNSRAGADALISRIDNAAEQVCGVNDGRTSVRQSQINRACEQETTDNGVYDIGHPVVIARYEGSGYATIEEGDAPYYDPRLDPTSPQYDATLDPASPYYIPPK
ncbi:MAG: UrcA family protein [Alphaproteobacteria bacterium]|nr:UrcA family protein [Alphaproteobacteria bacterium]